MTCFQFLFNSFFYCFIHRLRCFSISFTNDFCELKFSFFSPLFISLMLVFLQFLYVSSLNVCLENKPTVGNSMSANWASAMPDGVSASIDNLHVIHVICNHSKNCQKNKTFQPISLAISDACTIYMCMQRIVCGLCNCVASHQSAERT